MQDKKELKDICNRVYSSGFVAAYDGNLSSLTINNSILITRSAVCKGEVTEKDILEINLEGEILSGEGKISTESKMHLFIYKRRSDVRAVVHCHPPFTTAFAAAGKDFNKPVFPEVFLSLGSIPLCSYATPSTEELTESIEPYVQNSNALLLENHGAVTFGSTLKEAYFRMEKLEHTAKTLFIAEMLGGAKVIPPEKIAKLLSISESSYGIVPKTKI